jgi:peptidoglycan/LPS O-acetylase OafA/YrhL
LPSWILWIWKNISGPGALRLALAGIVFASHISKFNIGAIAVEIFFVLSGYWIYGMWNSKYSLSRSPYLTFFISRVWRLFPTFLACSFAVLLFLYLVKYDVSGIFTGNNLAHLLISQALILGYATLPNPPIPPAWSLDIEFQFYLIAPLLAMIVHRMTNRGRAMTIVLTAVGCAIIGMFLGARAMPPYLFFFLAGMLSAASNWEPSRRLALATLTGAVIATAAFAALGVLIKHSSTSPLDVFVQPAMAIGATLAIPYAIFTTKQKGGRNDKMFGDLSYTLYLVHWAAVIWLAQHAAEWSGLTRVAMTIAAAIATLATSWLLWRLLKPLDRLRGRWVSNRARSDLTETA